MPTSNATDIAYIRYSVPDLARATGFLTDFGLIPADQPGQSGRGDEKIWFRGHGAAPFLCELRKGPSAFDGYGLKVGSEAELKALSELSQSPVERIDAPGGGQRVRLIDPDGIAVDAVAGQAEVEPLNRQASVPWNDVCSTRRPGVPKRLQSGPAHVSRLGHFVMLVSDVSRTLDWLATHFGLLVSDLIQDGDGNAVAAFVRCDRGDMLTDHHTLNIAAVPGGRIGFHHAAFEVFDMDDLLLGRDHLAEKGHESLWGVGRHLLGSQVFDYWRDPWGNIFEHWTDGDRFTAAEPPQLRTLDDMTGVQWGPAMAPGFV